MASNDTSPQIGSMVKPNLDAIKRLTVPERVRLVQEIWDTLQPTASDLPIASDQRKIVAERLEEYRGDPDAAVPWPQLRAELGLE